tara:strand:+ start:257 stop:694 length:438 start_codon:yes stop_codon:yes gene_type:complete
MVLLNYFNFLLENIVHDVGILNNPSDYISNISEVVTYVVFGVVKWIILLFPIYAPIILGFRLNTYLNKQKKKKIKPPSKNDKGLKAFKNYLDTVDDTNLFISEQDPYSLSVGYFLGLGLPQSDVMNLANKVKYEENYWGKDQIFN